MYSKTRQGRKTNDYNVSYEILYGKEDQFFPVRIIRNKFNAYERNMDLGFNINWAYYKYTMRARWKVLGLAYLKLGTSSRLLEPGEGLVFSPHYDYDKAFLVAAHGSMGIGGSIRAR